MLRVKDVVNKMATLGEVENGGCREEMFENS